MKQSWIYAILALMCFSITLAAAEIGATLQENIDNGDTKSRHIIWIYFADKGPDLAQRISRSGRSYERAGHQPPCKAGQSADR